MLRKAIRGSLLVLFGLVLLPLAGASVLPTSLQTLYYDDFGGSGSSDLNGTTPDVTIAANTWSADSNIKDNGAIGTLANTAGEGAVLAFTPVAGKRYVLEATFTITQSDAASNDWLGLGFSPSSSTANNLGATGQPWLLQVGPDGSGVANVIAPFGGPNTSNQIGSYPGVNANTRFDILLDTTGAQWTAEFYTNGLSFATFTYSSNPTISYVAFTRNGNGHLTGLMDSFQLSEEVVPEPSTILLFGMGGMLLWWKRARS